MHRTSYTCPLDLGSICIFKIMNLTPKHSLLIVTYRLIHNTEEFRNKSQAQYKLKLGGTWGGLQKGLFKFLRVWHGSGRICKPLLSDGFREWLCIIHFFTNTTSKVEFRCLNSMRQSLLQYQGRIFIWFDVESHYNLYLFIGILNLYLRQTSKF